MWKFLQDEDEFDSKVSIPKKTAKTGHIIFKKSFLKEDLSDLSVHLQFMGI